MTALEVAISSTAFANRGAHVLRLQRTSAETDGREPDRTAGPAPEPRSSEAVPPWDE
jgi:hypothetical protein